MSLQALLLDLDDTLVPASSVYDLAMKHLGLDPNDPVYLRARAEVKKRCPAGYPASHSRRLYFKSYLEITDRFTPRRHLEMVKAYEDKVVDLQGESWQQLQRPRLFTELRRRFIRIGIVSNEISLFQSQKMARLDPEWRFFDFLIASEDLGREKPDPGIYGLALHQSGFPAEQCLFVGDNFACDVEVPRALGMNTIQTVEFSEDGVHDCRRIQRLDELLDL